MSPWDKEHIPDVDALFMRVHRAAVKSGLNPNIFVEHGGGMSVDWSKYSSAKDTRGRARRPEENGVIALIAGDVRGIDGLSVEHTPCDCNQAHTDILGIGSARAEKTKRRRELFAVFNKEYVIHPDAPVEE